MSYELKKLTPNLVVADVERSVAFYRDVLGFSVAVTVPDKPPYVFASVQRRAPGGPGGIDVFFNAPEAAAAEYPAFKGRPVGGTLTLFIEVTGVHALHAALEKRVKIVMPLIKQWYGTTEFAFEDPDGYTITMAEHAPKAD